MWQLIGNYSKRPRVGGYVHCRTTLDFRFPGRFFWNMGIWIFTQITRGFAVKKVHCMPVYNYMNRQSKQCAAQHIHYADIYRHDSLYLYAKLTSALCFFVLILYHHRSNGAFLVSHPTCCLTYVVAIIEGCRYIQLPSRGHCPAQPCPLVCALEAAVRCATYTLRTCNPDRLVLTDSICYVNEYKAGPDLNMSY